MKDEGFMLKLPPPPRCPPSLHKQSTLPVCTPPRALMPHVFTESRTRHPQLPPEPWPTKHTWRGLSHFRLAVTLLDTCPAEPPVIRDWQLDKRTLLWFTPRLAASQLGTSTPAPGTQKQTGSAPTGPSPDEAESRVFTRTEGPERLFGRNEGQWLWLCDTIVAKHDSVVQKSNLWLNRNTDKIEKIRKCLVTLA